MAWIFNLIFALSACLAQAILSHSKSVQGDNFCSDLMCITAFVNSSTITYQMTALNQLGWMAMGFGTQMTDAKMVIMWANIDGTVTLSQRTASALVEPTTDSSPPRLASIYNPLTTLSAASKRLSFTVPKDNTTLQNAVWALSFTNPMSTTEDANIEIHIDAGNFTLDLTKEMDIEDQPEPNPSQTGTTSGVSSTSPASSQTESSIDAPFSIFERMIIAHGVLSVLGFLILLPIGALLARWGRTFASRWFHYHWWVTVIFSVPTISLGWALGFLAVADQGAAHADDAHKICGILLYIMYIAQLSLGTVVHFRKPLYPKRHPPRNIAHGILGMVIVAFSFYETRTGITVEWLKTTTRNLNLDVFSNLWIAWTVFLSLLYFSGFFLLRRQLAYEKELPPPYSFDSGSHSGSTRSGMRRLLGLEPEDDGTHDIFSEEIPRDTGARGQSVNAAQGSIEMREVNIELITPIGNPSRPS